ncbi:MAG: hypothetical protein P0Y55_13145 [Candidatus Cohnella colombiensis]|uniref:PKD domain-containing protein n=1 Tax=Candidatus Cohnella colombiensis TaxID=3121368 RepID=A0AA95EUX0_9BACL|nr:MAG: hypothetical protein P0Y55_13145 [Cohnella sp.]
MNKQILSALIIVILLVNTIGGVLGVPIASGATPAGTIVIPSYPINFYDDIDTMIGYVLSKDKTKTVNINLTGVSGKKIKSLKWYDEDGKFLTNASGDWLGKTTYSGTDTISGKAVPVIAEGNSTNGVYYWSRSSNSNTWLSQSLSGVDFPNSDLCPVSEKDEFGLKKYPGCTDRNLFITLKRSSSSPYIIKDSNPEISILPKTIDPSTIVPTNVRTDTNTPITESNWGITGRTTSPTKYTGRYEPTDNPESIKIYYEQTFDIESYNRGYYHDFTGYGARQMWYYSRFLFSLEAKTYLYKDKKLYVEWEDVDVPKGTINIRHMVRTTSTGSYVQMGTDIQTVSLPVTNYSISNTSTYGSTVGQNVFYSGFFDAVNPGNSVSVTLTTSQKTAYVSFFYQNLKSFTGDFDIVPSTINWGDSFSLKPKNFVMNSCTYVSHKFKVDHNGATWISGAISGQSTTSSYAKSTYPFVLGVGSNNVSIKIVTSNCGESDWLNTKTLTVKSRPTNDPPQFKIGFVNSSAPTKPLTKVVEGTVLDLIYINDPTVPTPFDPDGDAMEFQGLDTSSGTPFIQSLYSRGIAFTDGVHNLTMNELGFHYVTGTMRDEWGAIATASTYIEVVPKNPVPIVACPAEVISGHPVELSQFNANGSYSPVTGRSIDHARDEWTNWQTMYTNTTSSNITVQVSLHVYDNMGLKSLAPALCNITVKPDLPPIAKLQVPPVGIRNVTVDILNQSISPDGDKIVSAEYKYKYDSNNNGFTDDTWQTLSGTLIKATFTPTQVGKYLFYIKVTEDYGQWDDTLLKPTSSLILDVVNDAPEVSFTLQGNNEQPDIDPYTIVTPAQMLNWPVYVTNSKQNVFKKDSLWRVKNGNLVSGEGRNFGGQRQYFYGTDQTLFNVRSQSFQSFSMVNNGYGSNRLSPWRSATTVDYTLSIPLVDTQKRQFHQYSAELYWMKPKIRSTKGLLFYDFTNHIWNVGMEKKIYALNPKKLSPLNLEVDFMTLYWQYSKGSPLEYVIDVSKMKTKKITYSCSYNQDVTLYPQSILDWELADRYLYTITEWKGYIPNCNISADELFYELAVYDALTGEKLKSSFDDNQLSQALETLNQNNISGTPNFYGRYYFVRSSGPNDPPSRHFFKYFRISHTDGLNVVLRFNSYTSHAPNLKYSEDYIRITPEFKIAKATQTDLSPGLNDQLTKNYVKTDKLRYILSDPFLDVYGNMYKYGYYMEADYPSYTKFDLHVIKYNSDYQQVWKTYLKPDIYASPNNNTFLSNFSYQDPFEGLVINTFAGQVYAKVFYDYVIPGNSIPSTMEDIVVMNMDTGKVVQRPSTKNGDDLSLFHYGTKFDGFTQFGINFDGTKSPIRNSTTTIEGNKTSFFGGDSRPAGAGMGFTNGDNRLYNSANQPIGYVGAPNQHGTQIFGEYFGDGVYVSMTNFNPGYYSTFPTNYTLNISVGTPSTAAPLIKSFTNGQFVSTASLDSAEFKFDFNLEKISYDNEWMGFSFRMKDAQNHYSLETDGDVIAIAKYVNGTRTVLQSAPFPLTNLTNYKVRIKNVGDQMNVWLNGIPILQANDTTYTTGKFGYFSDKAFTTFSPLSYKTIAETSPWSTLYAIWNNGTATAEVQYGEISFVDPENDPPVDGKYNWKVEHTIKFINNQGLSVLHGNSFSDEQLTFDKVGNYKVILSAKDDPHPQYLYPDNTFDEYRKQSNEFEQMIIVHRRPIASFTVKQATDGVVKWTDSSYDPDRYESATKYDTEDTGIDYKATKGIMEKKFYYVTPSGTTKYEKLVTPAELGTYEIGLAVKDEYSAWSDWAVQSLVVGIIPTPNTPPIPGFTASPFTTYRGVDVTINSTASDAEDGARENLKHEYYIRNVTTGGAESLQSTVRTSWTKTFNSLGVFTIRQVVEDSKGATAQIEKQVTIVNRIPTATVTTPGSSNSSSPTKLTVLRPEFIWSYTDADSDVQAQYQVRVSRYDGILVLDSTIKPGASVKWTASADLPEKVNMYVEVRVHDGYDWSSWSAKRYFYIETNQPPTGDFTWTPSPVYEGDTVQFITSVDDPDRDILQVKYEIVPPTGSSIVYSYTMNDPYANTGPSIKMQQVGTWTVKMTVSDGKATEVSIIKAVIVNELGVWGAVKHTPEWDSNRIAYNKKYKVNRDESTFWAGEAFVLGAETTNTGTSATKAIKVEAKMFGNETKQLSATDTTQVQWSTVLRSADTTIDFSKLENGSYSFLFTATYSNGTVKTATVTIIIAGSMYQYVQVHRIQ